ncbi:triose-phosphate isomerase [Turneriella parva]|uniref:Triosephosphate isomerase n=1 Tax=Turneriella parva (strain ATCC BAA-1111 / DSM 21527 / NCTC 11395 / H) TaxID=869212 RepID=I4B6G8_TURPD|nr:triose-phosphate isomerase [Turneriella parva]AFM12875.1 triosephosphate isomerase [Turneriella parva DSM 21527]
MRKPLIAGNWKMNLTLAEAEALAKAVKTSAASYSDRDVLVYPTFLQFTTAKQALAGSNVSVGVQNCSAEKDGAFTGEISASQARDAGAAYVLIGHSERRHVLKETDVFLKQKIDRVLEQGLVAMLCVGETLAERESGKAEKVVLDQLNAALSHLTPDQWQKIAIAYEPVWAIGTGKNATPEDAQSMHETIRKRIAELNKDIAPKVRILYGGSVKPDNIGALMAKPDIDGALVGGASLKSESFADLIKNAI